MLHELKTLVAHYLIRSLTVILHTKILNVFPLNSLQHGEFIATYTKLLSPNKSQQDAQFLKCIWWSILYVSDRCTVYHQEYLNTVYTQ